MTVVAGWSWAYPLLGAVAGLCAGLLGVGGGLLIVPMLALIFEHAGFGTEYGMHLALGTSMAVIVFTSISSMLSHHRHGAVRWDLVQAFSPGLVAGTFAGAWCAQWLDARFLAVFFVVFVYYSSARLLFGKPPHPDHALPGRGALLAAGAGIGVVSSLVAIGGATLATPYMIRRNVPVHTAIGTSSAIGLPVAAAGALGYMLAGQGQTLPAGSLGFVYLPALLGVALTTVLFAPLGARLAHRLPPARLRMAFAILLLLLATRMLAHLL